MYVHIEDMTLHYYNHKKYIEPNTVGSCLVWLHSLTAFEEN